MTDIALPAGRCYCLQRAGLAPAGGLLSLAAFLAPNEKALSPPVTAEGFGRLLAGTLERPGRIAGQHVVPLGQLVIEPGEGFGRARPADTKRLQQHPASDV